MFKNCKRSVSLPFYEGSSSQWQTQLVYCLAGVSDDIFNDGHLLLLVPLEGHECLYNPQTLEIIEKQMLLRRRGV